MAGLAGTLNRRIPSQKYLIGHKLEQLNMKRPPCWETTSSNIFNCTEGRVCGAGPESFEFVVMVKGLSPGQLVQSITVSYRCLEFRVGYNLIDEVTH